MHSDNKNPLVSVIIPVYNAASYLRQAIDSALGQHGVSVEVIAVDDGSTDGSWEVLESYGDSIQKVRQENSGPGKARNLGAQMAKGEWLAFLDADDEWAPEKLARQVALADEDVGLIYTDRLNIGEISRVAERQSDSVPLQEGDIFEQLLLGNFITLSSAMIHRDAFFRLRGFDERPEVGGVADWDLWLRHSATGRVGLCPEPLTLYRWHAAGMSRRLDEMYRGHWIVVKQALSLPRAKRLSWAVRNRVRANLLKNMAWCAAASDRRKALRWYAGALWYWPCDWCVYKELLRLLIPSRAPAGYVS